MKQRCHWKTKKTKSKECYSMREEIKKKEQEKDRCEPGKKLEKGKL